jgi:hypothetical protein
MRLMSTILFSGVVAFGVAGGAMAQDTTAQPPGPAQAGPPGDHRGGPPGGPLGAGRGGPVDARSGPRSPPSDGGVMGTVDSLSPTGFVISTGAGRKVNVETASSTTYRKGKSSTSASAIAAGASVMVLGKVGFGAQGLQASAVTAGVVIVQPAAAGGSAPAAPAAPFQRGAPAAEKRVGEIPADYVEGEGTIMNGPDAHKATEAALASTYYGGGLINRVVKLKTGVYEVHNVTVPWPHHIFVNQDFKVVGAF